MNHALETNGRVAAFFDIDGTIVPPPSLEWRFFAVLRYRRAIPHKNYVRWLAHAIRLAPQGIAAIQHSNKTYLRGVRTCYSLSRVPLLPEAIDRMVWHARQNQQIVLVSGTLAHLARELALVLVVRLAARGTTASVAVLASPLETIDSRWTGRLAGEAMFGEAKARAIRRLATEGGFDLERSYAYGDSASDRWMLTAVGRPTAVNPSEDLGRIARRCDWPVLWWRETARDSARRNERYAMEAPATVNPHPES